MTRLDQITLNESDEISIDVFNLIKASNTPLICFDRSISCVKMNEDNISSNGSKDLTKRDKFVNYTKKIRTITQS